MAYKFTEKRNDIQKQTTYILYMILGSYFRKCNFKKKRLEETLMLYYKEMQQKKQIELEEKVIQKAEAILSGSLETIATRDCEADIYRDGPNYCLVFKTKFERVIASVGPTGRYAIAVDRVKPAAIQQ